jgi:hypothetical protein
MAGNRHSDNEKFCNDLNGPKTPKMSERPLKTLQDFSTSKLMTRVRSFTCSNAFASYDSQRVAAARRLAGLTNEGDGFI